MCCIQYSFSGLYWLFLFLIAHRHALRFFFSILSLLPFFNLHKENRLPFFALFPSNTLYFLLIGKVSLGWQLFMLGFLTCMWHCYCIFYLWDTELPPSFIFSFHISVDLFIWIFLETCIISEDAMRVIIKYTKRPRNSKYLFFPLRRTHFFHLKLLSY